MNCFYVDTGLELIKITLNYTGKPSALALGCRDVVVEEDSPMVSRPEEPTGCREASAGAT